MISKYVAITRLGKISCPSGYACVKKVIIGHEQCFSDKKGFAMWLLS